MRSEVKSNVLHRAYMRDGKTVHYGEALLLACLLRAKGRGRKSNDMREVQKLMKDINLDKKNN
jgi:hypothetical protein